MSDKVSFNSEFIQPFVNGTIHVLEVQAQVEAKTGKPFLKTPTSPNSCDISGVISIVSEGFKGSVVISFPEATFLKVMSGMLGENYTEITQEIKDGAGEITNMIFGHAKVILNEKGLGIQMAIPSVVTGKGHSHSSIIKETTVIVPFTSSAGDFYVEFSITN